MVAKVELKKPMRSTLRKDQLRPITDEEFAEDRGKGTAIGQANAILEERKAEQ